MNEREARELGQERVLRGAVQSYETQFTHVLDALAKSGEKFTVDDVTAKIGLPDCTNSGNNVIGALMAYAAKSKMIYRIGYTRTIRRGSHGRIITVWAGYRD